MSSLMPGETGGIPDILKPKKKSLVDQVLDRIKASTPLGGTEGHAPEAGNPPPQIQTVPDSTTPQQRSSRPRLVGAQVDTPPTPQSSQAPAPDLAKLVSERAALDQKPTLKQALLRGAAQAAPIAIGGLFGGSIGASGAAGGVEAYQKEQQTQQGERRKNLTAEIEAERNRQERMGERQLTVEQARQASQERAAGTEATNNLRRDIANQSNDLKQQIAGQANTAKQNTQSLNLRKAGFKMDDNGQVVPIGPDERSDIENATLDYKKSQSELMQATEDLRRMQADPKSPQYALAAERLRISQQNAATAASRLGLSNQQFEMRAFGTNQGQPLPGAMITDQGQTVGSTFSQNVRPTGQERNKGDMAQSAHEQIGTMKDIVSRRPDVFGPAAGRKTDFTVWVGSQDPDAQRFRAARTIAGDHLAGTFGGRSEAALQALDNAIGQFKDNPAAVQAGLDQLDNANNVFLQKGKVKTVGSNAATGKPLSADQAKQYLQKAGGDKTKARAMAKQDGYTF